MISTIAYTYISDGILKGAPCFEIQLTDGVGAESTEAVDAILKIREFHAPGCKVVMLDGKFVVETQDTLYGMVKSLTDMGYSVSARSDGKMFFPWMTMLKFNSVCPEGNWLGFKVQEFIHNLPNRLQLPPEGASLFVDGPEAGVDVFLKSSPLLWRLWGSPAIYQPLT